MFIGVYIELVHYLSLRVCIDENLGVGSIIVGSERYLHSHTCREGGACTS